MRKKKTSATLVVWLAIMMVVLYLFGFLLKETVFIGNAVYKDTPIPALPFVFLFDSSYHAQLEADRFPEDDPKPEGNPDSEHRPVDGEETVSAGETDVSETTAPTDETASHEPMATVVYVKGKVTPDYFDDALFIGDSRTDGLYLYSRFEGADYFSSKGLTMFELFTEPGRDGKTMLLDLLKENTYGKIYIMLGINELGGYVDALAAKFANVIEELKALAPESILIIQANLSISEKTSGSTWYLTAERIHELNSLMGALADGERVFYLDANPIFCDENGYLKKELSGDGVHLLAKHYADWTAWLLENAFVPMAAEDE